MNNERKKKVFVKAHLSEIAPEGVNLNVGDLVRWENDYGVVWEHRVLGFNTTRWYNKEYSCFVHLDTSSYWMPHDHLTLTLV